MGNANADHLIDRILAEANETAAKIAADADAACAQIASERDRKIAENAEAAAKRRDVAVKEILDGAATRARLDGKKEVLAAKRQVLDQAFEAAYAALCGSSTETLAALYGRILSAEAENGDTVAAAKADKAAVSAAVSASEKSLSLSEEEASVERGFLLYGKGYEKDCSLKAILSELRGAEETKVAEILFS
ncbi:MAG: hypothetical protein IJP98_01440 [Clostridia bacterium]|nr:hypothetical protein [Clostridia bacterium]